jgi:aryl-alcohol dehydrogenase-like predicted oxidoreductase
MYLTSEEILGKWFAKSGKRKEIFLATKFGVTRSESGMVIRGDPEFVREQFDTSCKRLQTGTYVSLHSSHS